ncbi:ABC transporter substrate-binding protein [Streptomyces thermolineatus]|uniref:ABC transporter substrate-binding protein n=1 Tax=Streptomyces thermolineatus TaxID=44033 RepID=UPI00384C6681
MTRTSSLRSRAAASAVVVVAAALVLTACGTGQESGKGGSAEGPGKGGAAGTVSVTDAAGTEVEVPEKAERVVVLSELDLDAALTLGVEPVGLSAGRGQQGAPAYLADEAEGIEVVGAVTGPVMDKVIGAKPDLILAGQLKDEQVVAQLRKIAPTVVTFRHKDSWKESFAGVGEALNKKAEADKVLAGYDERVEELRAALGDRADDTVSVVRWAGNSAAVMQQGVFVSDVLKDLGVKRPAEQAEQGEGHSTPISMEALDRIDGDWLFVGSLDEANTKSLDAALEKKEFAALDAVEKGRVTKVDGSKWTSLGGPAAALSVLDDIEKVMVG